jgi:hypothetical protein
VVAATAAATTTTSASLVPAPSTGDRAAVVEIPDDDAPPPRWGQWENRPAPDPEPAAVVLVVRADGWVMPRRPSHGAEASSSRATLPALDAVVAPPKAGAGSHRRAARPLRRHPGRTGVVARVSRPWRLTQQRAERGTADPRGSRIADFPNASLLLNLEFPPCPFRIRAFPDFVSFRR